MLWQPREERNKIAQLGMFRNAVVALGPDHTGIREKMANPATTTVGFPVHAATPMAPQRPWMDRTPNCGLPED
jgi:hypothetical protein